MFTLYGLSMVLRCFTKILSASRYINKSVVFQDTLRAFVYGYILSS